MNAPKQKTLTELLDQIEQRYLPGHANPYNDQPKLVKALRRATDIIKNVSICSELYHSEIAQLLREPADSVPEGNDAGAPPGIPK